MSLSVRQGPRSVRNPRRTDPMLGATLDGRYQILELIGHGGMASVYTAICLDDERRVAIKLLRPGFDQDAEVVQRIINEGRAVGRLGHPNIVECEAIGFTADGAPYLVLELLEGLTLAKTLDRDGPFPIARAASIAAQIASAVAAAHARGVIHRDLKPENVILIERDGDPDHVKVIDFGVSKFAGMTEVNTQRGSILGTPDFMSPEQVADPAGVDARTDVYSLGLLLYRMLAGRSPFQGVPFPQVLHTLASEAPPSIRGMRPDVPEAIAAVIRRATAKARADRHGSMEEFRRDLLAAARRAEAAAAAPVIEDEVVRESYVRVSARASSLPPPPPVIEAVAPPRAEPVTRIVPARGPQRLALALAIVGALGATFGAGYWMAARTHAPAPAAAP